jgi:acetolactate synthase-1/3 small subunit
MIEISGQEKKIEAFIEAVRSYEIIELARTGRIALVRGTRRQEGTAEETPAHPSAESDDDRPPVHGHSEL